MSGAHNDLRQPKKPGLLVTLVTNGITVHGMGTRNASLVCLSTHTNFFSAEPVQQRWQNVVYQMIENI
jgi:hypothetical protein